jgi:cytochrome c553
MGAIQIPIILLASFAPLTMAAAPDGAAIVHYGNNNGALACSSCHGLDFRGSPATGAPALAGLTAAAILARLAHYAGPDGHNAMMRQEATALSPSERQAVAAYLANLPKAR